MRLQRVNITKDNLEFMQADEPLFQRRIITGDETWLYHYDPESKSQSMEWRQPGEAPPRKFKVQRTVG